MSLFPPKGRWCHHGNRMLHQQTDHNKKSGNDKYAIPDTAFGPYLATAHNLYTRTWQISRTFFKETKMCEPFATARRSSSHQWLMTGGDCDGETTALPRGGRGEERLNPSDIDGTRQRSEQHRRLNGNLETLLARLVVGFCLFVFHCHIDVWS